eukprot:COSAG06_NODE_48123_length_334_cov_0.902128_1_plen_74_part_10
MFTTSATDGAVDTDTVLRNPCFCHSAMGFPHTVDCSAVAPCGRRIWTSEYWIGALGDAGGGGGGGCHGGGRLPL